MPLVFAGLVPHPPLLVPSVGKENVDKVSHTIEGLSEMRGILLQSQPQTVIMISSHNAPTENHFSLQVADAYVTDFSHFGDFGTHATYSSNLELTSRLQRQMKIHNFFLELSSETKLDYSIGAPLLRLAPEASSFRIVPLYSAASSDIQYQFGLILQKILHEYDKRVAVIVSGDLSHDVPKKDAKKIQKEEDLFDEEVLQLIRSHDETLLLHISDKFPGISECLTRPLSLLYGVLSGVKFSPQVLSYEKVFGKGYAVIHFQLA